MTDYCNKRGWNIRGIYDRDDGVSGTTFDREDFLRMMSDVERGLIDCVIVIDLSRFGRDRLEAGRYRERLTDLGVRFIAIEDNHDSINDIKRGMNLEVIIKETFNEFYPSQISQKVRAVKQMMSEQGKFCNSRAPYGYRKSEHDKHVLVIDENVKYNVIRIFDLYISGTSARAIAETFNREGIPSPNEYYYKTIGKPNPYTNHKNLWTSGTITQIITNPAFYGAMSNGKRAVRSYKNKTIDHKPVDEWIIVEGTHPAIIPKDRWEQAQSLKSKNKKTTRATTAKSDNIFAGIINCGQCDGRMTYKLRQNKKSPSVATFRCSTWIQKGKEACQQHAIDYTIVYKAILAEIQSYAALAEQDERKLIDKILKANNDFTAHSLKLLEKSIRQNKNRLLKIDKTIQALYEDRVNGDITIEQFKQMTSGYEQERFDLTRLLEALESEHNQKKLTADDLGDWVDNVRNCLAVETLTRSIVVELIDRITVSETDNKEYDISIQWKFRVKK
jgi:DNA invertase Pin-like site-specific DNA recombinase